MLPFVLYSLGFIMIGLSYFVLHARRSPINSAFSGFTVSIATWIISIAFIHSSNNVEPWVRLSFARASFIPCTFVTFARVYPNVSTWPTATTARLALVLGGVFASLALFTDLIVHDAVKVSGVLTRQPGMLYYGFALYFVVVWMAALAVLLGKWKRASGLNRLQLRYLGTGIT